MSKARSVSAGDRFGRWTALESVSPVYGRKVSCRCDCGTERVVRASALVYGGSGSCGCVTLEKLVDRSRRHGSASVGKETSTWRSWASMNKRCNAPGSESYEIYGGRGIRICERWTSFESFLADMGERPDGTTLDRIDTNGHYEPGNCRWATCLEQNQNRRSTRLSAEDVGAIRARRAAGASTKAMAKEFGVDRTTIQRAIRGKTWRNVVADKEAA